MPGECGKCAAINLDDTGFISVPVHSSRADLGSRLIRATAGTIRSNAKVIPLTGIGGIDKKTACTSNNIHGRLSMGGD